MSQEEINNQNTSEETAIVSNEESKKKFSLIEMKLPKWVLILLMTIPSAIIIGIILLVDVYIGFPENINPIAIIAIIGISLVGIAVISDMVFRNYFIYRMIRRENVKSKIYKDIIKEREAEKKTKAKFDSIEDEYEYDEDGEEYESIEGEAIKDGDETDEVEEEIEEEEDEYQYELEDEDESKYYRMKSLILRGGIFSILFINGIILLGLAVILQFAYAGGFQTDTT